MIDLNEMSVPEMFDALDGASLIDVLDIAYALREEYEAQGRYGDGQKLLYAQAALGQMLLETTERHLEEALRIGWIALSFGQRSSATGQDRKQSKGRRR